MKSERITIIFLVLLCCSLVLTGCKDTEEEKATAEATEVKAAAEKAAAEKATAEIEAWFAEKTAEAKAAAEAEKAEAQNP